MNRLEQPACRTGRFRRPVWATLDSDVAAACEVAMSVQNSTGLIRKRMDFNFRSNQLLGRACSCGKPAMCGQARKIAFARYTKLMVFVLDNYDSFTYNLVQYL